MDIFVKRQSYGRIALGALAAGDMLLYIGLPKEMSCKISFKICKDERVADLVKLGREFQTALKFTILKQASN